MTQARLATSVRWRPSRRHAGEAVPGASGIDSEGAAIIRGVAGVNGSPPTATRVKWFAVAVQKRYPSLTKNSSVLFTGSYAPSCCRAVMLLTVNVAVS
jgi:hypothetical protein